MIIGEAKAARLALAFLHDTWAMVGELPWARPVLATTTLDGAPFDLGEDVEIWLQGDGDLGERMERVLARGVDEAGVALLIGADVPGTPSMLASPAYSTAPPVRVGRSSRRVISSEKPRIAFSGVRNSWLILARN